MSVCLCVFDAAESRVLSFAYTQITGHLSTNLSEATLWHHDSHALSAPWAPFP